MCEYGALLWFMVQQHWTAERQKAWDDHKYSCTKCQKYLLGK